MKRIDKVAVLGSGVMGSAIAAHLANAGISVLLLDMVPPATAPGAEGRSRLAETAVQNLAKLKPAPLFLSEYSTWIETGNFEDDAPRLKECDWVIEAVLENLAVKQHVFTHVVVPNLKEGAILSTNTSGLSVEAMAQFLPEELRTRFLVTHFFNPPRYMRLMEIVPGRKTSPETVSGLARFIEARLGKGVVYAKDTPNFIANRIGTYAGANAVKHMLEMGFNVEEVDALTGPALGRPKTATFGLWDLVGIDTVARVCANTYELLPNDDERDIFRIPDFITKMVAAGQIGKKAGQGFYQRQTVEGKSVKFFYDHRTGGYLPTAKPSFPSVGATKQLDLPAERIRTLIGDNDRGAEYAWKTLRDTLIYAAKRIPEISDDIANVDNAMKWGYNWELGPFETLDGIGVAAFVARADREGIAIPEWLRGVERFYKIEGAKRYQFNPAAGAFQEIPVAPGTVSLTLLKEAGRTVERNPGASLIDLGDGVFCVEFHGKMNTIGPDVMSMIGKGIRRAEEEGIGLVIGNEGSLFSAGANLMLLAMAIAEGEYDDVAMMVKGFQKAMMGIKYAKVPVVAAPHQLVMGGGCETCLHADAMVAHAETYMGLVEIGVGLLPAGGGTKEMALRAIRMADENGADVSPFIFKNYQTIAMAKVSTSAAELFRMGMMRPGDAICMNLDRRLHDAKLKVIDLAANYRPGRPVTGIKAPGRSYAASMKTQLWNLVQGGYISEYDRYLASTIADVITGGDVPGGTLITEEYLLDLEREAFLKLCGQKKTLERIQHMLKKGRPLRN
ncbi:3-hydroxyacyl-CoA dehydrogenase/enoyl-CoA hydratase family protein [Geomesophilobacter sediminis]|uniref:Enoyl-CoA hydratase/isomerase family protein n=1 Tax=Geomesophilobacter sediminis TaxID=2798584 RepID=A0A8J7LXX6_9BACT|nr:3-hydroxyacyl-CoA dehydrogenase/enoyl-CoA hydratase family protein [Geomesophilobacter sediminis]MBJ6723886.1 enoyl-CoA hydratase/isomerase family protein [Geomesophilobacter sediminis]